MDHDTQEKSSNKTLSEEPPIPPLPSALRSLLKEEINRHLSSNMREAAAAAANAPVAVMPPSSLQSLLKDNRPNNDDEDEDSNSNENNAPLQEQKPAAPTSKLSSLLKGDRRKVVPRRKRKGSSPSSETEWWNEKPMRPVGYVKHFQPMNTSYVRKFEAPRDYSNVVTAQTVSDDDDDSEENTFSQGDGPDTIRKASMFHLGHKCPLDTSNCLENVHLCTFSHIMLVNIHYVPKPYTFNVQYQKKVQENHKSMSESTY